MEAELVPVVRRVLLEIGIKRTPGFLKETSRLRLRALLQVDEQGVTVFWIT
jgi:hypothetical protein